jgi:hypothetical protein
VLSSAVIVLNTAYMRAPEGGHELTAQQFVGIFGYRTDLDVRL